MEPVGQLSRQPARPQCLQTSEENSQENAPAFWFESGTGRWMKATTFRISDRGVVHHILTGVVPEGFNPGDQISESKWGASLGGYGPISRCSPLWRRDLDRQPF